MALLKVAEEKGIDVNARDNHEQTPLFKACCSNFYTHKMGYCYIRKQGAERDEMFDIPHRCIRLCSDMRFIKKILEVSDEYGIELNPVDKYGNTPVHLLFRNKCPTQVKAFMEVAKDYNFKKSFEIRNKRDKTPWEMAEEWKKDDQKKLDVINEAKGAGGVVTDVRVAKYNHGYDEGDL